MDAASTTPLLDQKRAPSQGRVFRRLTLAPDAALELKSFPSARSVVLLVGPEGGLSPSERARAEAKAMQVLWGDC